MRGGEREREREREEDREEDRETSGAFGFLEQGPKLSGPKVVLFLE